MKKTPLKKVSKKRAAQMREYSEIKPKFLAEHQHCEVFEPCCTRKATEIHHINGRNNKRLLDRTWWLPACQPCHRFIHDHPKYAREAGFLK